MEKIVFWGIGNVGKYVLGFWKSHGISPDFFCDNASEYWGKRMEGVLIISPKQVYELDNVIVYITCRFFDKLVIQLTENGISKDCIIRADNIYSKTILDKMSDKLFENINVRSNKKLKKGCFIDLSCGMVLGGVERWSYALAASLKNMGIDGSYLVPKDTLKEIENKTFPISCIGFDIRGYNFLDDCISRILCINYNTIICNFPFEIFIAACMVKKLFFKNFHIVAVIHSDDESYYRTYCDWNEYIDECLVISKRIKCKLVEQGFPDKKIKELYWKISCIEIINKNYSCLREPLKIGYAGRLKLIPKRLDLVIEVAEKLKKKELSFLLQIAGVGDYEDILRKEIKFRKLDRNVILIGYIEHESILQFWEKQDIFLSCSDWEGHSISQSEAMAAGAVPIVTNTSGAEDDIRNGYNGYIVKLQDVDAIVQHIEYLYQHRDILSLMGKRAHDFIVERNKIIDEEAYWREIIFKAF